MSTNGTPKCLPTKKQIRGGGGYFSTRTHTPFFPDGRCCLVAACSVCCVGCIAWVVSVPRGDMVDKSCEARSFLRLSFLPVHICWLVFERLIRDICVFKLHAHPVPVRHHAGLCCIRSSSPSTPCLCMLVLNTFRCTRRTLPETLVSVSRPRLSMRAPR